MTTLNSCLPIVNITSTMFEDFLIGREYLIKINQKRKERRKFNFTSEEAEKFINNGRVSDKLYQDTERMSKGDKLVHLNFITKGIETNQWIRFAIYYMTDPLATVISFAD